MKSIIAALLLAALCGCTIAPYQEYPQPVYVQHYYQPTYAEPVYIPPPLFFTFGDYGHDRGHRGR